MNKPQRLKVGSIFFILGAASGLWSLYFWRSYSGGWIFAGLFLSLAIIAGYRWSIVDEQRLEPPIKRYILTASLLTGGFPLSVLLTVVIAGVLTRNGLLISKVQGTPVSLVAGLYFATIFAAIVLAATARLFMRQWRLGVYLIFQVVGTALVTLALAISFAQGGNFSFGFIIFVLGQATYSAVFGIVLIRYQPEPQDLGNPGKLDVLRH